MRALGKAYLRSQLLLKKSGVGKGAGAWAGGWDVWGGGRGLGVEGSLTFHGLLSVHMFDTGFLGSQAGIKLNPPASAFRKLGLQECTNLPGQISLSSLSVEFTHSG